LSETAPSAECHLSGHPYRVASMRWARRGLAQLPRACTRIKGRPGAAVGSRPTVHSRVRRRHSPSASTFASPHHARLATARCHVSPHCQSRKSSPSRCAPSSRRCHTFSLSRSITPSAPPSCYYPSCCHHLSMRASIISPCGPP
jgi:hypothetical protein